MFAGVPPISANATSALALIPCLIAWQPGLLMRVAATAGAYAGARLARNLAVDMGRAVLLAALSVGILDSGPGAARAPV